MKKGIIILIISCAGWVLPAQELETYRELVKEAFGLYENKKYLESGKKYSEAFAAFGNKGYLDDRYNAACSWALAEYPDSAFFQLFRITEVGNYNNLGHITADPDLKSLHGDNRWNKVIGLVRAHKARAEAHLERPLADMLDTIYREDQMYRLQISEIEEKYGRDSEEMQTHWNLIRTKDSINLIVVKKILDERGWLGADKIGYQGNSTLFLVIQHSDQKTQETYLPMMREAVKKGDAAASSLALLEDRVALGKGEKQIYGSQIGRDESGRYYVMPLLDPANVDKRRAEVGLQPLQDYVHHWNITWDVEEYKKSLREKERMPKTK